MDKWSPTHERTAETIAKHWLEYMMYEEGRLKKMIVLIENIGKFLMEYESRECEDYCAEVLPPLDNGYFPDTPVG